jgi:hypothetical protein
MNGLELYWAHSLYIQRERARQAATWNQQHQGRPDRRSSPSRTWSWRAPAWRDFWPRLRRQRVGDAA